MGGLKDLLLIIPQLLLYFVPGFICLWFLRMYWNGKKVGDIGCVVSSIALSYVVYIVFEFLKHILPCVVDIFPQQSKQMWKIIIHILMGASLGLIIRWLSGTPFGEKVWDFFNPNSCHNSTVWEKAMCNEEGAVARIYLKNGMFYDGELVYYTKDPDDEKKEILLFNYKAYVKNTNYSKAEDAYGIELKTAEVRATEKEMEKVYISQDEIVSVEINPRPSETGSGETADKGRESLIGKVKKIWGKIKEKKK
ncbi:hypothetical protein JS518_14240 [Clostridiales bacterium FE2010]|nr:hypothetical protein JS518_14240 [Clostridiales bacterium FE2010]